MIADDCIFPGSHDTNFRLFSDIFMRIHMLVILHLPCFVDFASAAGRGSAKAIEIVGREDKSLSRRVVFRTRKSLEQRGLATNLGRIRFKPAKP